MKKLRRLLRLYLQGKSKLLISNYLDLSRNTVSKYTTHIKLLNKPIEEILKLNDIDLEKLFIEQPPQPPSQKLQDLHAFFPYMDCLKSKQFGQIRPKS